eukprot:14718455-Alexandrium_andersonii.AAC.1
MAARDGASDDAEREDLAEEGKERFKRLRSRLNDEEKGELLMPFLSDYHKMNTKNLFAEFDKRAPPCSTASTRS